ncbi:MAG: hypothetical protein IPG87_14525 [Saprospiraceae bacterium]|nr:hypothetical protein [Candidatus Vicinibacter affinis]MBK7693614.1 hypothetical protein [Candidatus Vicinibacter affinis]MBK7799256.1 hypothetical protein [Candidatus Vicinibacter affinis]MBP6398094.1 hypothetical protein [Saprospiraceae bacterium]
MPLTQYTTSSSQNCLDARKSTDLYRLNKNNSLFQFVNLEDLVRILVIDDFQNKQSYRIYSQLNARSINNIDFPVHTFLSTSDENYKK